jgi:hypothetical protein
MQKEQLYFVKFEIKFTFAKVFTKKQRMFFLYIREELSNLEKKIILQNFKNHLKYV